MQKILLFFLLLFLMTVSLSGPGLTTAGLSPVLSAAGPVTKLPQTNLGAINAPLAVLWAQPKKKYAKISLQAAADPAGWTAALTLETRQWLVDKADTMALFGERVVILDRRGNWLKVAAVAQRTKLHPAGYPGWVLAKQVARDPVFLAAQASQPQVIIIVPRTVLFRDRQLTLPLTELSWQVKLPLISETPEIAEVRLPDGTSGYLPKAVTRSDSALSYHGADAVAQARQFTGQGYLWAGTSAYGFDCSGLTFRVYQSQGISLPRDANEQALEGLPVAKADLLPGDLLFFAADNGRGEIHHVGIYSGHGMMLHAPNNRSPLREESMETGKYAREYWGARRYSPPPVSSSL